MVLKKGPCGCLKLGSPCEGLTDRETGKERLKNSLSGEAVDHWGLHHVISGTCGIITISTITMINSFF